MKSLLSGALLALVLATAASAATNVTFTSQSIKLPDSDRDLPAGTGVDTVAANCTACHSPAMILNQPALNKAAWAGEVAKMKNVYKAPVDDKDVDGIVNYLVTVKGTP